MTDMQKSLLLLIVRSSILNPVIYFSTQPLTGEMKCPTNIPLPCAFHCISSNVDATHAPTNHKWCDPLHIIMWSYWFIDLDFTCSSPLLRSIDAKLLLNLPFTLATGPSSQVLSLIFSTLVTWLNVMSYMQWAPSSHVWALQHLRTIFTSMAYVAHTHVPMD